MGEDSERVCIQPQTGLGDIIQALPYIEKLVVMKRRPIVATNHGYALAPFQNSVGFEPLLTTEPVTFNGIIPIIRDGFFHLRYNRYGEKRYKDIYFDDEKNYEFYAERVRQRYMEFYNSSTKLAVVVFAPPRAAERHKKKNSPFECAPHVEKTFELLAKVSKATPVVLAGKDDIYPDFPKFSENVVDMRNSTTFSELCALIRRAAIVVSQASAITSIAGLFGIPTIFLPAAGETPQQHAAHDNGIVWPGQVIL